MNELGEIVENVDRTTDDQGRKAEGFGGCGIGIVFEEVNVVRHIPVKVVRFKNKLSYENF